VFSKRKHADNFLLEIRTNSGTFENKELGKYLKLRQIK
jgi:hypothetical protein